MMWFRRLAGLMALTLATAAMGGSTNLVPNGNFSKANSDGKTPQNWAPYKPWQTGKIPPVFVESYLRKGGMGDSACLEIGHSSDRWVETTIDPEASAYAQYSLIDAKSIVVAPDKYYKFSLMYKTNSVEDGQVAITFNFIDKARAYVGKYIYYLPSTGGAWQKFEDYCRPIRATDRGFSGKDSRGLIIRIGVVNSLGTARFDDVSLYEVSKTEYTDKHPLKNLKAPSLLSRRKVVKPFSSAKTYTLRKDSNGAWWFVKPDGTPFWWRGVQTVKLMDNSNPLLYKNLQANYKKNGETTDAYLADTYRRLGMLGFNSHAIGDARKAVKGDVFGECYLHPLSLNSYIATYYLQDKNGDPSLERKPQQDPYNPEFKAWLKNHIYEVLDALPNGGIKHPNFAGYFTDNEISVEELDRFIWSPACTEKFISFVKNRYGNSISAVNKAWTSRYATFTMKRFDDIRNLKDKIIIHHLDDPLAKDLNAFTDQILKDYYKLVCQTIRKYECERLGDKNKDGLADGAHIIVTNKFNLTAQPNRDTSYFLRAWKVLGTLQKERPGYYYNLVAVVQYPGDSNFEGICTQANLKLLEQVASLTGLPVLIAEFAVHGRDSGILIDNVHPEHRMTTWFNRSVDTQADRARVYDKNVRQWAAIPGVVGAQWLNWFNGYQTPQGPPTLPVDPAGPYYKGRNCGLADDKNNYYTTFTDQIVRTHMALDTTFLGKPSSLRVTYPDTKTPQLQFRTGQSINIAWDYANLFGKVVIQLRKSTTGAIRTLNPGTSVPYVSWSYKIGKLPEGTYQIRIASLIDGNIKDTGETFRITPAAGQPWIKLAKPSAALNIAQGKSTYVQWTSGNLTGKVKVALYEGETLRYTLATGIDINKRSYTWKVGKSVAPKKSYELRVISEKDGSVFDNSPLITVTGTSSSGIMPAVEPSPAAAPIGAEVNAPMISETEMNPQAEPAEPAPQAAETLDTPNAIDPEAWTKME